MAVLLTPAEKAVCREVIITARTLVQQMLPAIAIITEAYFGDAGVGANDNAADILATYGVTKQQLADAAFIMKDLGSEASAGTPSLGRLLSQKLAVFARIADAPA